MYFVVPAGDEHRPSGGNRYDEELARELGELGWSVHLRPVAGVWPRPAKDRLRELSDVLEAIPDHSVVLLDGLIACGVPDIMATHCIRQRLVILVHLPLADEIGLDPQATRELDNAEREALGHASAAAATSCWTAAQLTKRHGLPESRVHVAVPGVHLAPVAPGTPSGGRHLLCVASTTERKGHTTLVKALASLPNDLPWHLEVAGAEPDPAYATRLRALIAEAGLGDRISLLGPLVSADLDTAYARADLLVLPSDAEPYGMCVTEALARGVPVYASDVGGVPEAMGYACFPGATHLERPGRLIPPGDTTAWADALGEWMLELALRDRLRTLAEQRQHTLPTWRSTALKIAGALQGHPSTPWQGDRSGPPAEYAYLAADGWRPISAAAPCPPLRSGPDGRGDIPPFPLPTPGRSIR